MPFGGRPEELAGAVVWPSLLALSGRRRVTLASRQRVPGGGGEGGGGGGGGVEGRARVGGTGWREVGRGRGSGRCRRVGGVWGGFLGGVSCVVARAAPGWRRCRG